MILLKIKPTMEFPEQIEQCYNIEKNNQAESPTFIAYKASLNILFDRFRQGKLIFTTYMTLTKFVYYL